MDQTNLLLGEVSRLLTVKPYQIEYALKVGLVEEPLLRIGNKRIFQSGDIERLKNHFQTKHKENP